MEAKLRNLSVSTGRAGSPRAHIQRLEQVRSQTQLRHVVVTSLAEYLPAGVHELHYFALAGNGGDYLAAPAQVELMYGKATHARTAAERLRILPPADAKAAP